MHRFAASLFIIVALAACGNSHESTSDGGSPPSSDDASPFSPDASFGPPSICTLDLRCAQSIVDEPKRPCELRVGDGDGNTVYEGWAGVEKRGRSSQSFPKAQYGIELWADSAGLVESSANLLGMGKESDWILNGAYIDRALFRNPLLYDLFQSFGGAERYAPEVRFCNLEKDGVNEGIYHLSERVKRDDDRVAIVEDLDFLGKSFLLKQDDDTSDGFRAVVTANGKWQFVYPHRDRVSPSQVAGVSSWLDQWNAVVTGQETTVDLFSLVNLDSAVDFVLIEEFAKNNDAFYLSMHVWKDQGGLLHFVPWDFDLSFGQPNYNNSESPEEWIAYRPALIWSMAQHPAFQNRLSERWLQLRQGLMSSSAIHQRIDQYLLTIADSIEANFVRWPIEDIEFLNSTNLYPVSSHEEEVQRVRTWIDARLTWMDQNIARYGE